MRKKLRRIFAWTLAICLIMTVINVPMEVKAESTQITAVSLINDSIPESITADMKITEDMQSASCDTTGCSVMKSEWNESSSDSITPDTVLNAGDTIYLTITLTASGNYEFAAALEGNVAAVTLNGRQVTSVMLHDITGDGKAEFMVGITYTVQSGSEQPGGEESSYTVDFGTGSWTIDGAVVTADRTEIQTLTASDLITLTNFNADTMEARIKTNDGFQAVLTVTGNQTSISTRNNEGGVPDAIIFEIAQKTGGEQPDPGSNDLELQLDNNSGVYDDTYKATYGTIQYSVDNGASWQELSGSNPYTILGSAATQSYQLKVTYASGSAYTAMLVGGLGAPGINNGEAVTISDNYHLEFSTGNPGPGPGSGESGSDDPAPADAIKVRFVDKYGNALPYEDYQTNSGAEILYSYDQSTWNEFTADRVEADSSLFWNTNREDMLGNTYYFANGTTVYLKVTTVTGEIVNEVLNNVGDGSHAVPGPLTLNQVYTLTGGTEYNLLHSDNSHTIIWSYDVNEQESMIVKNGKVVIVSAVLDGQSAMEGGATEQGGYVWVKGGATVTVKLIPDYGYQTGSLELNGQALAPQAEEATYTFTMPGTNLHLAAIFTESNDEINITANGVTGGSITGGENVIASGNLRLSVADSGMSEDQKNAMQGSDAATDVTITNYLEVDLEKFVKKGNSADEWKEDLEELSNKIKIVLNVGTNLDATKSYVVVREHNGLYEKLPAVYDASAGTLTFESDKFSDYAVGTMETVAYVVTEGANGTVSGDSGAYRIKVNGELADFVSLYMDGNPVSADNYTLESGSTIITLKAEFVRTLSAGSHTVRANYINGFAETSLTVTQTSNDNANNASNNNANSGSTANDTTNQNSTGNPIKKDDVPKTGDSTPIEWYMVLALISGIGLILTGRKQAMGR